jgi:hypothetical protein
MVVRAASTPPRGEHDHRPTLHDLRLDIAREIAVDDRARLGLKIQRHQDTI